MLNSNQNASQNTNTPSNGQSSQPQKEPQDANRADLNPAVAAFADAIANESVDAVVDAFTADATVIDVSRPFNGHEAIRSWATNELVGGSLRVIEVTNRQGGQDVLVEFTPQGSSSGFQAEYHFDVNGGKITKLNMQYPD